MRKFTDINYDKAGNPERKLDILAPDTGEKMPVFVYFHGGGLEAGDKVEAEALASYLVPRGIIVVTANYRMYPEAVFPEYLRDAAEAIAFVKKNIAEYGGDPEKIFTGGTSAGGYISMMLCYDPKYLSPYGIKPTDLSGFVHDAGQPTAHFNVLRERGIDSRRVIVDETAPLYFVGQAEALPPQLFIYSDHDMENRPEQHILMLSTLRHFRYDFEKIRVKTMHGTHCAYVSAYDDAGDSIFGKMIYEFMEEFG